MKTFARIVVTHVTAGALMLAVLDAVLDALEVAQRAAARNAAKDVQHVVTLALVGVLAGARRAVARNAAKDVQHVVTHVTAGALMLAVLDAVLDALEVAQRAAARNAAKDVQHVVTHVTAGALQRVAAVAVERVRRAVTVVAGRVHRAVAAAAVCAQVDAPQLALTTVKLRVTLCVKTTVREDVVRLVPEDVQRSAKGIVRGHAADTAKVIVKMTAQHFARSRQIRRPFLPTGLGASTLAQALRLPCLRQSGRSF